MTEMRKFLRGCLQTIRDKKKAELSFFQAAGMTPAIK